MLDVRGIRKDQGKGRAAGITSSDSFFGLIKLSGHCTPQVHIVPPLLTHTAQYKNNDTMLIPPK